ncbi:hypothetical protein FZ025_06935 [Xanthomonas hyacinthi]|nr:hypothetical protein FZ025_06935 [Xanthomonas hyacinthi]
MRISGHDRASGRCWARCRFTASCRLRSVGLAHRTDREVEQMQQCCKVQQLFAVRRVIMHVDSPCGVGRRCGSACRWCGALWWGLLAVRARRSKLTRLAAQLYRAPPPPPPPLLLLLLLFLLLILIYRVPYVAANRAGKTPKGRRTGMCAVRGRGRMPLPRIPSYSRTRSAKRGGREVGCAFFWLLFFAQAKKSNSPQAKAVAFAMAMAMEESL